LHVGDRRRQTCGKLLKGFEGKCIYFGQKKRVLEILMIKQTRYLHVEQMSKSSRFEQISGGFRFIVNVCLSYSYSQGREDAAKTCATHSLNSRKKKYIHV